MKEKNQNQEKTPLQRHLEQLFEQMKPDENAPKAIKDEVFSTIETIELVSDITDLFTGKFSETEGEFLDIIANGSPEDEE